MCTSPAEPVIEFDDPDVTIVQFFINNNPLWLTPIMPLVPEVFALNVQLLIYILSTVDDPILNISELL